MVFSLFLHGSSRMFIYKVKVFKKQNKNERQESSCLSKTRVLVLVLVLEER